MGIASCNLVNDYVNSYPCLKEPRSFRGCLEQVNQEAFEAFHLSHDKMGAIELSTKNIPGERKTEL